MVYISVLISQISYLRSLYLIVYLILIGLNVQAQDRTLAFPGAEGFGKYTTGGRGGKIIIVTNLNDDGAGTLREAIKTKGPRIILFAVSGNIELQSTLDINQGDVTIAGQSAPGDGICIKNFPLNIKANNVVIRFLRFRLGDESKQEADAITGNKGVSNVIIDHCSMSWATDECASFYRNKNFTLQWCIISESLNQSVHAKGEHGYGGIWGGEGATFHHNLIASHTSRTPRFSGSSSTPNSALELVDFVNNVIYNWSSNSSYGGEKGKYNIINNYYKAGPATKPKNKWMLNPWSPYGKFYVAGNVLDKNESATKDNRLAIKADDLDSAWIGQAFAVEQINLQSAENACDAVLKYAGASLNRDAVDARVIAEVRSGNSSAGKNKNGIIDSQQEVGGWPVLKTLPVLRDTDQDGMPDAWEVKHKLNPNDPSDSSTFVIDPRYSNIEMYLNGLVDSVIKK